MSLRSMSSSGTEAAFVRQRLCRRGEGPLEGVVRTLSKAERVQHSRAKVARVTTAVIARTCRR